jgi:tetratricopeptide (TPR) repeat protein
MKCIVKGCENEAVKQNLCEEHYDPNKLAEDGEKAAGAVETLPIERHASLLLHSALLVSGKLAGRLVQGYKALFSVSPHERAQILDHLACADLKKGRKAKSLEALKRAAKMDPENPQTHFKLGECYMASGENKKACESFNKVLELDPESVEACRALGEAHYSCKDFKPALKILRKGHKLSPQSEKINYLIGLTHDKLGSYDDAIKFLQAAVDMNPRRVEYYYSLGFAYESSGDKDQALLNFKKAVELERNKVS